MFSDEWYRMRYKFENEDKGFIGFDTKDDMLEGMEKDHSEGMKIPEEY